MKGVDGGGRTDRRKGVGVAPGGSRALGRSESVVSGGPVIGF